jgi:hypothetical protein
MAITGHVPYNGRRTPNIAVSISSVIFVALSFQPRMRHLAPWRLRACIITGNAPQIVQIGTPRLGSAYGAGLQLHIARRVHPAALQRLDELDDVSSARAPAVR